LLRPLPRQWHLYVWPFVSMFYPVFTYVYYNHYDTYLGSEEWTFVALGGIITLHAMTFLVCQWSVDFKALFTCIKVYHEQTIVGNGSFIEYYSIGNRYP
jgi:cation-transporting ATPase 13A1